jgi:hypothetical protein
MTKTLNARVTVYTGTASQWASADVVLLNGELGYATDTKVLKIGDGISTWNSLPKAVPQSMTEFSEWASVLLKYTADSTAWDTTPTENSTKPVTSGGLYDAFAQVQASLNFDDVPIADSDNPVKSGGIYNALATKVNIVDIVDGLDSTAANKPLSARQGKVLREILAGLRFAKSFATIEDLVVHLNNAPKTEYFVGYDFYIEALEVPDFWITEVKENLVSYTYSTDAALINAVKGSPVQIGYYKISLLETAKVDLSEYAKTTAVTAAIASAKNEAKAYTDSEILAGNFVSYDDEMVIICGGDLSND